MILLDSADVKILPNVPLAPLTTLRVGGPAHFFAEASTITEVREAIDFAKERKLPLFVLGGGSNLLVSDAGFRGLVLHVANRGIKPLGAVDATKQLFAVAAGESWDDFVEFATSRNLAGVESLSGIPGSVGATPVQNVGAYGQDVSESISSVTTLDLRDGNTKDFNNSECGFAYRISRFNTVERNTHIILSVTFALTESGEPALRYADLRNHFAGTPNPTVAEVRQAVLTIRASKGMVLDELDPCSRSAGSFFKNPVLSENQFRELKQKTESRGLRLPAYPALAAQHKVSAAWLVEQAGFHKGYSKGSVGISCKHALAIVNRGNATAADVVALKEDIQCAVADQFGISLHAEPVLLGFEATS